MKKTILFFIIILIIAAVAYLFFNKIGGQPETGNEELNNSSAVDNGGQPETGKEELTREISVELVAEGFVSPVAYVSADDGSGRMFLVDQIGVVKVLDSAGNVLENNFLDLRGKLATLSQNYDEKGLLGLAFHPNFKENGRLFVHYSAPLRSGAPANWNHTSILSEFSVDENNADRANQDSEKIILQIDQPQANHNGGHIDFGPDGYLYISLGDGGAANDVGLGHSEIGNGQDISTLLGKILRIDIDRGDPYSIPADNPFVGKDGLDEIFAYGFRNPYHISFDKGGNNEFFAADVGQDLWEEVNIAVKGGNYGWNIREGTHCFDPANPKQSPPSCPTTGPGGEPLVNPIIEYGHSGDKSGVANVGGYVYRGEAIKGLAGNYVFADCRRGFSRGDGSVFAASLENGNWSFRELNISNGNNGRLELFIKGIGRDAENELYLLTTETLGPAGDTGKIYKIAPSKSDDAERGEETEIKEEKISIKNFLFIPQTITISAETKITWTNEDSDPHTVTSQGNFDSDVFFQGETFSFIFNEAGTFDYICTLHPNMRGRVIVE